MIRIEHLKKSFADVTPLKDVSVTINDGDVISLIGPSGAGKSTLLRCINLLEKPDFGDILVGDEKITDPGCDIERIRRRVGMVFQSFNLFPHLCVIENIMLAPVDLLGKDRQEAYNKGMELLQLVGLSKKAMNYPEELSGGQKQRVAIARTLAMDPEVILMDEPTSALDPAMTGEVQAVIRDLAAAGRTMMIVTHEMEFAKAISNRILYMDEGGIYEEGDPGQIFDHPQKEKTRRFVRRLKVLEFDIEDSRFDYPEMQGCIEEYCVKNGVPSRMMRHLRLAFEEIVLQNLVKRMGVCTMHVTVSFSEENELLELIVDHSGDGIDFLKECDGMSMALLKSAAADISFSRDEENKYRNHISARIR